jgi:hypothetical protein
VTGAHRTHLVAGLAFGLVGALFATACGRIGFEPPGLAGGGPPVDGGSTDGGASPLACADLDLGSALGPAVATGTTAGKGDDYRCRGTGNTSDVALGWTAPAAGRYVFDLCNSDPTWDSALNIRDGSCAGPELSCSDSDDCPLSFHERVTLTLAAQQHIVIVIDGADAGETGLYQLAIAAQ